VFAPFSPGDSLRVYRLQRRGTSLDLQRNLMQPYRPLTEAWLAFLTQQAMGQPTYVLYDQHAGEAFIQVRYRPHQAAADVTCLAPALEVDRTASRAWPHLLDGAGIEAAGQGIQRIFANLPASGAEVDIFQQVGFTLYAEEEIYQRTSQQLLHKDGLHLGLRTQRAEDWPALQKLCVAITPQRVRQAEGGIGLTATWEKNCRRYVLPAQEGNDLIAGVTICGGGQAHWLRLLVHPSARHMTADLVLWGLLALVDQPTKVVYCNVRQYENGARDALEESGFRLFGTRSLMFRHTMAWVKTPVQEVVPSLKSSAEAVPPAYRINGDAELASPDSRLAAETRSD
jgi:hypothetical protein